MPGAEGGKKNKKQKISRTKNGQRMKHKRKRKALYFVAAAITIFLLAIGIAEFNYGRFERGVCRANLISYTKNHIGDRHPEDIEKMVKQDMIRDNIGICDKQKYLIRYDAASGKYVITIGDETIAVSSKE